MPLTHSQLKYFCQKYDLVPSKQYGQNYLINDGIVEKIVKAADLQSSDTVVEIGPGFGVLTMALAEQVEKVYALEIERKLIPYWEDLEIRDREIKDKVELKWGNALKYLSPISHLLSYYKIIANLPYQITSQILRTILELENKPSLIVVMVQKEVAQRICAKPPDMSLLALSVQYYGQPEIVDIVTKGNFWPAPKVDSAILKIGLLPPHPNPLLGQERGQSSLFFKFAKAGFAQKRKQLWKNLSEGLNLDGKKVKIVLKDVMENEKVRAEELSVNDWLRIIPSLS